jgi:hypothetical protein
MGSAAIPSQSDLITYAQAITGNVLRRSDETQKSTGTRSAFPSQVWPKHPTNEAWTEKNREKTPKIRRNTYKSTYFYVFTDSRLEE